MSGYHLERTLLLEHDPAKLGTPALRSLRDADWRHQRAAMVQGYSSLAEMAVDELIVLVRELQQRLDRLEGDVAGFGDLGEIVP